MFKSSLREKWNNGTATVNGWLNIGNSFTAEIMAVQDYDSVTIDIQHGAFGFDSVLPMVQAMKNTESAVLVRVPWRTPGDLMKVLDLGVEGIICPMVNNAAEAAELAGYCHYPPHGERSFGPTRAQFGVDPGYFKTANAEVLIIAMIETGEALENVDEIIATPGIDGLYIGPADLTLGVTNGRLQPGQDREEPEMLEAIQTILKAAKNAGKFACMHTGNPAYAARAVGWGFDMVTIGSDARLMAAGAADSIKAFRNAVGQETSDGVQSGY